MTFISKFNRAFVKILQKHQNFHNNVLLRKTHVKLVTFTNYYRRVTDTTVYPRGIKVKNVRRKAIMAYVNIERTPAKVIRTSASVVMTWEVRCGEDNGWGVPSEVTVGGRQQMAPGKQAA